MTELDKLADLFATDFTAAVKAHKTAQEAAVETIQTALAQWQAKREEGMKEVRAMRVKAGELIAESLRLEQRIDADDRAAAREIDGLLAECGGKKRLGRRVAPKAIAAPPAANMQ